MKIFFKAYQFQLNIVSGKEAQIILYSYAGIGWFSFFICFDSKTNPQFVMCIPLI